MAELGQSPDELVNQVHATVRGSVVPVVRTDPQAYMVNDGTNDRVMMGGFGDGTFGIKVSKSGFDVKSTGNANLVMSSAFNSFKILATGTVSVSVPNPPVAGTTYSTAVAHGLGFAPAYLAFLASGPGLTITIGLPWSQPGTASGGFWGIPLIVDTTVDATNFTARVSIANTSTFYTGTWVFKYYFLQETAT